MTVNSGHEAQGFGAPERKYLRPETGLTVTEGRVVEGYASLFGMKDQGGDVVMPGAYGASLKQRLEWPSKRDARTRAARAQTAVAEADAAAVMSDLEAEVRLALIALGVAREEMRQATADAEKEHQFELEGGSR